MALETYEVSYEGDTNERFKTALLERLMLPAYERAGTMAALSESEQVIDLQVVYQYEKDDGTVPMFTWYTVYASKSEPRLDIIASTYDQPSDLSSEEAQGILLDVLARHDIPEEAKNGIRALKAQTLIDEGGLSYVTETFYEIDLVDNDITVTTEIGIAVNNTRYRLLGAGTELDEHRRLVFGHDDVVDIVRALHGVALIDEAHVRHFLDADF